MNFFSIQSSFNKNDSRYTATDYDPDDTYQARAYRDMTINTSFERTINYFDTTSEEDPQNYRQKTNSTKPNNIDNSTLSLHIAEHENSIQSSRSVNPNLMGFSFGPPLQNAKKNLDLSFVNDPLEPLQHVEKKPVAAETMPFKTSLKLLNLNSSVMKKIPPKPLPRSRTLQAIVNNSNVVNAISNDLQHLNLTRNLPDPERTSSDHERTTSSIFGSTSDARSIVTDAKDFLDGFCTSEESNDTSCCNNSDESTIQNDDTTLNEGKDAVTNLENYELMKKLQNEGQKPQLFDKEKFLCDYDDLNDFVYDPVIQNSHLQQEQLSLASDGAELQQHHGQQHQRQHHVFDSTVEGDTILQNSLKDEEEIAESKFLNEIMQNSVGIESKMFYMNQPFEECLGHLTPHDQTLELRVDVVNNNFDAEQTAQEPEVQPPRAEVRFAAQRSPTCVMVEGGTVTELYEFVPYKEDVQVRPP
uniref:Uncharacterized protein n=1 Tax=Panagrolaimus sp. PS1159 TaxID=55785 RepID=A0AC35GGE3_9BILA